MDLWIRTQKKTNLIKVKHVFIDDKRCILPEEDEGIKIVAPYDDENAVILGRYKTEERALEVLDEIQEYLSNGCKIFYIQGDYYTSKYEYKVYEMPKE